MNTQNAEKEFHDWFNRLEKSKTLTGWMLLSDVISHKGAAAQLFIDGYEKGVEAQQKKIDGLIKDNEGLLNLTMGLDEHPDDYNGACYCKSCMTYADCDE